jgi:hypothetical protein
VYSGLHVNSSSDSGLLIQGITASLLLYDDNATADQGILDIANSASKTQIRSLSDALAVQHIFLAMDHSNGNVGIGTSSPSESLHIDGGKVRVSGISNQNFIELNDGTEEWWMGVNSGSDLFLGTSGINNMFIIDRTNGNVGIGISNPSYLLDAAKSNSGATNTLAIRNTSNTASSNALNLIEVAGSSSGDPLTQWKISGVSSFYAGIDNSDSDNWKLSANNDLSSESIEVSASTSRISFPQNTDAFKIKSGGNGTTPFSVINSADTDDIFQVSQNSSAHGEVFILDSGGNGNIAFKSSAASYFLGGGLGIGTSADPTGNGSKVLFFGDNTTNPTMDTDTAGIFAKDVAGTVEMFAVDESNNVTQLSSHNPKTGEWRFYSENTKTGRILEVDLEKFFKHYDSVNGTSFLNENKELSQSHKKG